MNTLYYGDNLPIMRQMAKDSVDLIYLDPPFNSKRTYNLMYKTMTGMPVPEQVEAFCDAWELDAEKDQRARDMPKIMLEYGIDDYYVRFWSLWIEALRNTQPHLLAYLIYMVERLLHMRVLLRPAGSIYLHCDPTASHYIKVMMDGIFGHQNFINEIIWKRSHTRSSISKSLRRAHDTILCYSKAKKYTFNLQYRSLSNTSINLYKNKDDNGYYQSVPLLVSGKRNGETGKPWKGIDPNIYGKDGMHWVTTHDKLEQYEKEDLILWPKKSDGAPRLKYYLQQNKGVPLNDIWDDIQPIQPNSPQSLGYPTQKPIALLERIIETSSNKSDTIFDPFCGCGTAIYAAHTTERQWIGCDIAILPINLIKHVLEERYRLVEGTHFTIDGIPVSIEQAETLFHADPFQFQHWLVERVGGFPMQKKVADRGIDGRLYFDTKQGLKEMVLSVKGGSIRPENIRELRGVLERESQAELAGFLSLRDPTRAMRDDAATAGMYEYEGMHYPRIQLLTVREIVEAKRTFQTPTKIGVKGTTGQMNLRLR